MLRPYIPLLFTRCPPTAMGTMMSVLGRFACRPDTVSPACVCRNVTTLVVAYVCASCPDDSAAISHTPGRIVGPRILSSVSGPPMRGHRLGFPGWRNSWAAWMVLVGTADGAGGLDQGTGGGPGLGPRLTSYTQRCRMSVPSLLTTSRGLGLTFGSRKEYGVLGWRLQATSIGPNSLSTILP